MTLAPLRAQEAVLQLVSSIAMLPASKWHAPLYLILSGLKPGNYPWFHFSPSHFISSPWANILANKSVKIWVGFTCFTSLPLPLSQTNRTSYLTCTPTSWKMYQLQSNFLPPCTLFAAKSPKVIVADEKSGHFTALLRTLPQCLITHYPIQHTSHPFCGFPSPTGAGLGSFLPLSFITYSAPVPQSPQSLCCSTKAPGTLPCKGCCSLFLQCSSLCRIH